MLTLIATLGGFISSFAPALINMFTRKADQAHEQRMAEFQLRAQAQGGQISLAVEVAKADTEQQRELYRYAAGPSGNKRVDALQSLVRPYITMIMFHLWLGIETLALVIGYRAGMGLTELVNVVWDEPTQAIFGAIMGFWFGNRAMKANTDPTYAAMPTIVPTKTK